MKKIAIVGAGPTGIYTLFSLLQQQTPLSISIFEQADEAGVGMPYSDEENSKMMLANIASIEIRRLIVRISNGYKSKKPAISSVMALKKKPCTIVSFYREFCWANISAINFYD